MIILLIFLFVSSQCGDDPGILLSGTDSGGNNSPTNSTPANSINIPCLDKTLLFCDNFDDNNLVGWISNKGGYSISTTSNYSADGSTYSVQLTGGNKKYYDGITHDMGGINPATVSFWAMNKYTTTACGFVSLQDYANNKQDEFLFLSNGHMYFNATDLGTYSANTWYYVVINIDWYRLKSSVYINNVLITSNITMNNAIFDQIGLYNYSTNCQSWIDEIKMK